MKNKKPTQSADPSTPSAGQALRRKAEAKLKAKGGSTALTETVEAQRLVHKLQVYQIELEMQNEELMQTQAELKSTLSMYSELYAFAPVGYFTLARNGTIRRANLTGAKLLGLGLGDLIERRFGLFISAPLRATFDNFLDKVFTSGKKEACEVTLEKNEPALFRVFIEAIRDESIGGNEICYAIVSDISGRK